MLAQLYCILSYLLRKGHCTVYSDVRMVHYVSHTPITRHWKSWKCFTPATFILTIISISANHIQSFRHSWAVFGCKVRAPLGRGRNNSLTVRHFARCAQITNPSSRWVWRVHAEILCYWVRNNFTITCKHRQPIKRMMTRMKSTDRLQITLARRYLANNISSLVLV